MPQQQADDEKPTGESEDDQNRSLTTRNRLTGLVLVVLGGFVILESSGYAFGTPARMGPGFLPVILGGLTIVVGALIAAVDQDGDMTGAPVALKPAALVLGAMLAFALLIDRAGLIAATAALVLISSVADEDLSWRQIGVLLLVLLSTVYVVFVQILSVPFELVKGLS